MVLFGVGVSVDNGGVVTAGPVSRAESGISLGTLSPSTLVFAAPPSPFAVTAVVAAIGTTAAAALVGLLVLFSGATVAAVTVVSLGVVDSRGVVTADGMGMVTQVGGGV